MGGKASTYAWKAVTPISNYWYGGTGSGSTTSETVASGTWRYKVSPFVFKHKGSMYYDEDGHLAHEFFVEVPVSKNRRKAGMKRIHHNLTPQILHHRPTVSDICSWLMKPDEQK